MAPCPAFGFVNCGWLKMLKNSARNCTICRSVTRVVFNSYMSQLNWPGPE